MFERMNNPTFREATIGGLVGVPPVEKRKDAEDDEPGTWQIIVHKRVEQQIDLVVDWVVEDLRLILARNEVPLLDKDRKRMHLAVYEAVVNAARHGNLGNPEGAITVQWGLDSAASEIGVIIADQGRGFDGEKEFDLGSQHGRGILLMKHAFDVEHKPGLGRVTMRKNILAINAW